jgi:hypothetical protein
LYLRGGDGEVASKDTEIRATNTSMLVMVTLSISAGGYSHIAAKTLLKMHEPARPGYRLNPQPLLSECKE